MFLSSGNWLWEPDPLLDVPDQERETSSHCVFAMLRFDVHGAEARTIPAFLQ